MSSDPGSGTSRSALRVVLLWVLPVLAGIGGLLYYRYARNFVSTDNAYVKAEKTIVSAEVAARVRERLVTENDRVRSGQPVLVLDDQDLRIAVVRAEADLASLRTDISSWKAAYAEKLAELDAARRQTAFAERELQRQRDMAARKLIATASLDAAEQTADAARSRVLLAERDVAATLSRLGGKSNLPADDYPVTQAAASQLALAKLMLGRAQVLAPRAGVASHLPQVGDRLEPGKPAFAIVSDADLWIEANFKETDVGRVVVGQPVEVTIDSYGDRGWHGHVQSIAQATGAEFGILPAQNASGNWIKVVQRIPVRIVLTTKAGDPPLRAGMSAQVRIDTRLAPLPR